MNNWVWSPQGILDMHRPEKWGYLQFTLSSDKAVRFRPDHTQAARALLQEIYYRQRAFRDREKRWARTVEELTLQSPKDLVAAMAATDSGYRAEVTYHVGTKAHRCFIEQDSKVWCETPEEAIRK